MRLRSRILKTKTLIANVALGALLAQSFFAVQPAEARKFGGDEVNNGAGLAERIVLYAYDRLPLFMSICLKSSVCKVSPEERLLLTKISDSFRAEREANDKQIQFDSETTNPGFFIIDGVVKLAKTGREIGSPIYVNIDLLYTLSANQRREALPISDVVAMLIHELGHHQGNHSHQDLDYLGVKVASTAQNHMQTTPLLPFTNSVAVVVINEIQETGFPEVLLYAHDEVVDITAQFKRAIKCPGFHLPIPIGGLPDLGVPLEKPRGAIYNNLFWEDIDVDEREQEYEVKGSIAANCQERSTIFTSNKDYKIRVSFDVRKRDGKWFVDENRIRIEQKYEPWWKFIVLPF